MLTRWWPLTWPGMKLFQSVADTDSQAAGAGAEKEIESGGRDQHPDHL